MDPRKRENKDELTERVLKSREVFNKQQQNLILELSISDGCLESMCKILFRNAPVMDLNFCRLQRKWLPGVTMKNLNF
jgi:hypothetical protein